ncbi:MAG: DUF4190 domain-containing protein [Armatimonadota bacterium]|nr:DUF4190 domain-containing protein [Armatimonadota bacterium]
MEQPYGPPSRSHYNLGLASLIVGIAGIILGCCFPPIAFLAGIVAIVLGVMSMNAENRAGVVENSAKTLAIIGIVLGGLGCLFGIGGTIWFLFAWKSAMRDGGPWRFPGAPRFP